jgi:hypothetical protein
VFEILDPLGCHLGGVVPQEFPLRSGAGGGVSLKPRCGPPYDVAEEMMGGLAEDAVSQRICRGKVSHPQVKHGGMIARVDVVLVQLLIRPQRHGGKAANLERVASLSGLHDPIEEPVKAFLWRHGANIWRPTLRRVFSRPLRRRTFTRIRTGICHVRDRRRRCPTRDLVDDSADQQEAEHACHPPGGPLGPGRAGNDRVPAPMTEAGLWR